MRLVSFEIASRSGYAVLTRPEFHPVSVFKETSHRSSIQQLSDWEETEPLSHQKLLSTKSNPKVEAEDEARIKPCPFCGKRTFLIDGCNYMECSKSDPPSSCLGEWCFQCLLPKYRPVPGKEYLGCCNDKSHNSH